MHGNDVFHAEEANSVGRFPWAHREPVADWKHRYIEFIQFAEQLHIAEQRGIAGMINGDATGKTYQVTSGFAGIEARTIFIDRIGMHRVGHADFEVTNLLRAAFAHGTGFLSETFAFDPKTRFENSHDFGAELFGQRQKIAEVIGVRMGEKNGVQTSEFFQPKNAKADAFLEQYF